MANTNTEQWALEELGFYLDERDGVWVVFDDGEEATPANLTERVLWDALKKARASLSLPAAGQEPVAKLWLWKNFVNGRPEYWAFDNPFPCVSVGGDPLTFGEPCGWALLKPSVNGRPDRSEQEVTNTVVRLAAARQPAAPYSIDADPQGIRATVADAITGALAFGAQGVNKPPEGHWLAPFWNAARADKTAPQPAVAAGWMPIETAPKGQLVVVGWLDHEDAEHPERFEFDYLEDGCWMQWHEHAEHVEVIGGHGVSYTPPYTHWMPLGTLPHAPSTEGESR